MTSAFKGERIVMVPVDEGRWRVGEEKKIQEESSYFKFLHTNILQIKSSMSKQPVRTLDPKKVSGELFVLTYGAMVTQLLKDYEDEEDVNVQLDKMGYNIGLRIIDDFLAKNPTVGKCNDFRETAEVIAKHGFRTYMGVTPTVSNWNASADEFSLLIENNPLTEFVEFPSEPDNKYSRLKYSQVICGVLRGAMEMVHMEVNSWFVQDQLKGDPTTEIRVKFIRKLEESVPMGED